VPVRK